MSRRLLHLLLLLIAAGALLFMRLPIPPTYAGRTVENAGHVPLFFLITLGIMLVMRDSAAFRNGRLGAHRFAGVLFYGLAGLAGAGLGFLSEVVQRPLRRDASWEDVIADILGAVCALGVYALFDRRFVLLPRYRLLGLAVAVTCIAIYLAPIVTMTRAYLHRNGQFPVLADFHSRLELYWTIGIGVRREIVAGTLHVEFVADQFPGLSFHEPVPDWRAYEALVIDVENPAPEPLDLGVRVNDIPHNRQFSDRFNRQFELAAGERRVLRIGLDEVKHGPRSRLMDMQQISDITLFRGKPAGSRQLRVHGLRLE